MDKSVPRVTVWHHSVEPRDAKTMTLGTDLSIPISPLMSDSYIILVSQSELILNYEMLYLRFTYCTLFFCML